MSNNSNFGFMISNYSKKRGLLFWCLLISLLATNVLFYTGCKDDNSIPFVDPNALVPDPEGTVAVSMRNGNNGGTSVTYVTPLGLTEFWDNNTNNFEGDYWRFVNVGQMRGLGNVFQIPTTGWTSRVPVSPGSGYVGVHIPANNYNTQITVTYIRLYVTDWLLSSSGAILGAEIKYQSPFPFKPSDATKVTVSDTVINLPSKGENSRDTITVPVTFTPFNANWTVTSNATWCTLFANDLNSFNVRCESNYDENGKTTPLRTALLTVKVEGLPEKIIKVNQFGWPIAATSIRLNKRTLTLGAGEEDSLKATVTPMFVTDTVFWTSSDDSIATVVNGIITAKEIGEVTITAQVGNYTATCIVTVKHPLIFDKGIMINGVKWATRNVDAPGSFAAKVEDPGMFYQWNRKKGWPATGNVTGWDDTAADEQWAKSNDPSPDGWRLPSLDDIKKLLDTDKVDNEWTTKNGVSGRLFTDKATGNSIFLPAAGFRAGSDGTIDDIGLEGNYWSGTRDETLGACGLDFSSEGANDFSLGNLIGGYSIRCVAE